MTLNLSFAGCGFLGIYHVGVACCFKQYAPHLLVDKIAGASAGAIAACCLLCRLPIGGIISDVLDVIREARKRTLGPFSPSFNVEKLLREGLDRFLPDDAHKRVSGKLRISLTRVYDGKNVIFSDFHTREELIQALLATSWVPLFSGLVPPKLRGARYIDGGFSNNLPTLDENTITVSPFCGESDICPRDSSSQLFHMNVANTSIELSRENAWRIGRILFPPKPEILAKMCKQGFDDALRFLSRNNMINCKGCLAVQSTFTMASSLNENSNDFASDMAKVGNMENDDNESVCDEFDPECRECRQHRKEALLADMPEAVKTVFQEAIDSANRGFLNWIFRHRGMKLLSIMTVPYILPFEITYATCMKLIRNAPSIASQLLIWAAELLKKLSHVLEDVDRQRKQISNNIICQLNVTQYGDFNLNAFQETTRNHLNVLFRMDMPADAAACINSTTDQKALGDKILSRRSSLVLHHTTSTSSNIPAVSSTTNTLDSNPVACSGYDANGHEAAIDHILKMTTEHDAVLSYFYMDEYNKMNVTEIFDVTVAESAAIFDPAQNQQQPIISSDCSPKNEKYDHELEIKKNDDDDCGIFSDPESEWIEPDLADGTLEPESDQRKNSYRIVDNSS